MEDKGGIRLKRNGRGERRKIQRHRRWKRRDGKFQKGIGKEGRELNGTKSKNRKLQY